MNFRVGLNTRSLVSDASWGRYGVTETIQKTVSRSLDLVNNAIFFEVDEGWPQWNVKLYSENEFENVMKVVRGEKWQFYMCCILPLFSPAKLGGESDQEEKLAATLDKTFFQLQTFAKMFLSLIHTSYKKLTTILQVTYRLDTPNMDYLLL